MSQIVTVGGGPVGAAFAIAAAIRLPQVNVAMIERGAAPFVPIVPIVPTDGDTFDHRVYALSPTSIALLEAVDVWRRIAPERLTPVTAISVWSDADNRAANLPKIHFDQGAPLAVIVEHRAIVAALYEVLTESRVERLMNVSVDAMHSVGHQRHLSLSNGRLIKADIVVAADGRQSQTRELAGIDVSLKDYDSVGIIANFHTQHPHGNVARQWFTPEGILAYLPLPSGQISIVWSVGSQFAKSLPDWASTDFVEAVAHAGKRTLGRLTLASPVEAVPLQRSLANRCVAPSLALIGDAAHAVHPMAGQGVNLGFGDIRILVDTLANRSAFAGLGDEALLRRYARGRAEATVAISEATDCLHTLFSRNDIVSKWIRRDGFGIFDWAKPIKRLATDFAVRA